MMQTPGEKGPPEPGTPLAQAPDTESDAGTEAPDLGVAPAPRAASPAKGRSPLVWALIALALVGTLAGVMAVVGLATWLYVAR